MNRNSVVKGIKDRSFKELCAHVVEDMKRLDVPGVSIAVWHNDSVMSAGLGITSVEHPLPVTADTLFQVGSISKTFTGTMLMQLAEAGKIDLDTPVKTYLPKFKMADSNVTANLTTRHLLTHTGGWRGDYFNDLGNNDNALELMVKSLRMLPQISPLGTLWSYNNAGFNIAGRLIEVLTNQTYEQAAQQMLFNPLKLSKSFFYPNDAILTQRFAVGHQKWPDGVRVATPWAIGRAANAVGGVVSTVNDLMRYAQFHSGNGNAIIERSSLLAMRTAQTSAGGRGDMGITWFIRQHGDVTSYGHGGATKGQKATFRFIPDKQFGIAILTNSDDGGIIGDNAVSNALDIYLGLVSAPVKTVPMNDASIAEYVGEYEYSLSRFTVVASGVGILIHETPKGGFPKPESPAGPPVPTVRASFIGNDKFVVHDEPRKGEIGDFVRDANGQIAYLRIGGRANPRVITTVAQ
jgi:CubicO group peptidase (beta-lactamase class C family)